MPASPSKDLSLRERVLPLHSQDVSRVEGHREAPGPVEAKVSISLHYSFKFSVVLPFLLLAFKSLNNQAPIYLSDVVQLYIPSRQLHSSSDIRPLRLVSICAPQVFWSKRLRLSNTITLEQSALLSPTLFFHSFLLNLSYSLRHSSSTASFKSVLLSPTQFFHSFL